MAWYGNLERPVGLDSSAAAVPEIKSKFRI